MCLTIFKYSQSDGEANRGLGFPGERNMKEIQDKLNI